MSDCCDPVPYRRFFNRKEAERNVRVYRRRGLDPMAESMISYLKERGVGGSQVLEVGGGVGAIGIELLRAGASSSTNVELSAAYDEAAQRLADEEGFGDRVARRVGDFVAISDQVESADIVVMNRVLCCYPWVDRLMGAAMGRTTKYLAIAFPRDNWWVKGGLKMGNTFVSLRGCEFRSFVHPVRRIESLAEDAGMAVSHEDRGLIWQTMVLERAA